MKTLCENCGQKPDKTGMYDSGEYLVPVWSVERQEQMFVCYLCFRGLLDSEVYKKVRQLIEETNAQRARVLRR